MFLSLVFAQLTCTNSLMNECSNIVKDYCAFDTLHSNRPLTDVQTATTRICNQDCGMQYVDLYNCLQNSTLQQVCVNQWNMRCNMKSNEICYKNRVDNWSQFSSESLVDNALLQNIQSIMPCTECTKQAIFYDVKFDDFVTTGTKWSTFTKQNALKSCGNDFLNGVNVDYLAFSGVNLPISPQQVSQNQKTQNTILIIGISLSALLVLLIIFFAYRKYKGKRPLGVIEEELEFITKIDFKFVATIFDIRPFFRPLTKRKVVLYIFYCILGAALAGFGVLPNGYMIFRQIANFSVAAMIIQIIVDPLLVLLGICISRYPKIPENQTTNLENPTVAVVICTHNSAGVIEETINAALNHFEPQNIYVADNGFSEEPLDNTKELVHGISDLINYRWTNIGNKTLAQYLTVRYIHKMDKHIKHCLLLDDDVTVPLNLRFPVDQLEGNTKCMAYGIRGVDYDLEQKRLFTKWQDMEYKVSDFVRIFQDNYSSVLHPHGAISLWDKETLLRLLHDSDSIFYAEDVKMGKWVLQHGYHIAYYGDALVNTWSPETLLGEFPNYYSQRVRSWDFAEHMLTWTFIKLFFTSFSNTSFTETLILKFFHLYSLYTIVTDWIKVPGTIYVILANPDFLGIALSGAIGLNAVCILMWNYISCRNRPDVQVTFMTIITFPIYKVLSSCVRIIAMLRCALVYWPRYSEKEFRPKLLTEGRINHIEKWGNNKKKFSIRRAMSTRRDKIKRALSSKRHHNEMPLAPETPSNNQG